MVYIHSSFVLLGGCYGGVLYITLWRGMWSTYFNVGMCHSPIATTSWTFPSNSLFTICSFVSVFIIGKQRLISRRQIARWKDKNAQRLKDSMWRNHYKIFCKIIKQSYIILWEYTLQSIFFSILVGQIDTIANKAEGWCYP